MTNTRTNTNDAETTGGIQSAHSQEFDEVFWNTHPSRAVKAVEALPQDYLLRVTFDNDVVKVIDFQPYLYPEDPLRDLALFRQVATNGWTLVWPDGSDTDTDTLYYDDLYPASWYDEPGMTPDRLRARKATTVRETIDPLPAATG